MKKSILLGKLYDYLYFHTGIPEDELEVITKGVLDICEEEGMLPPDRFNNEGDCYTNEWDRE